MTITEPQHSRSRWRALIRDERVLTAIILIVWLVMIISIGNRDRLWDFKVYYYAAVAQAQGENPYSLEALNKYSPDEITLPFVYPQTTCYFFRPFTLLPYNVAYHVWLWLKVAFAVYLFWLWRTRFIRWGPLWLMLLIGSGAYLSGLYRDMTAGNVSLIEQALLWTGFWWLLDDKPHRFAVAVALAAIFKFTLAFFLVLLLFTRLRGRWSALILGLGLVAGHIGLAIALDSEMFADFLSSGLGIAEFTADFNHSTLAVIHDIGELLVGPAIDGSWLVVGAYLLVVAVVFSVSVSTLVKIGRADSKLKLILVICVLCFFYALAAPRMKNYTHLLLIVPTYIVVTTCLGRRATIIFTILLVLPRLKMASPDTIYGFYQYLHPWVMTMTVWLAFLRCARANFSVLQKRMIADGSELR